MSVCVKIVIKIEIEEIVIGFFCPHRTALKARDVFVLKQCLKFVYLVASLKGMSGFLQQVDYNFL